MSAKSSVEETRDSASTTPKDSSVATSVSAKPSSRTLSDLFGKEAEAEDADARECDEGNDEVSGDSRGVDATDDADSKDSPAIEDPTSSSTFHQSLEPVDTAKSSPVEDKSVEGSDIVLDVTSHNSDGNREEKTEEKLDENPGGLNVLRQFPALAESASALHSASVSAINFILGRDSSKAASFHERVIASSFSVGLRQLLQTAGVGVLRPNTLMLP